MLLTSACTINQSIDSTISPSLEIDFENPQGSTLILDSEVIVITVENPTAKEITSISVNNQTANWIVSETTCTSTLSPGTSCSINVKFTSNGDSQQEHTLQLEFEMDGETLTKDIPLSATGLFPGSVSVEKTYPENGANWNDYVLVEDFTKKNYMQQDVDCSGVFPNGRDFRSCIHGGERLKVRTGQATCEGLSIEETLGAFKWTCDNSSGEAVYFTISLKDDKGLADLLENPGTPQFKQNSVVIKKSGTTILSSSLSTWWANEVLSLPDNSAGSSESLTNPGSVGRIYLVDADQETRGYSIDSDKIALVTMRNSTLFMNQSGSYISVPTKNFLWIEGRFDGKKISGTGGLFGICYSCQFVNLRLSRFKDFPVFQSPYFSRIRNLEISHNNFTSFGSDMVNIGSDNVIYNFRLLNNEGTAGTYHLDSYVSNVYQGFTAIGNGGYVELNYTNSSSSSPYRTMIATTQMHNTSFRLNYMSDYTVSSFLSVNSAYGIHSDDGISYSVFSNTAAFNSSVVGMHFDTATGTNSNIKFSGVLLMGNNTKDCSGNGDSGTDGLFDGTCSSFGTDGSSGYGAQLSNALLRLNRSVDSSFFGKITIDTANSTDSSGAASYNSIPYIDFFNFDSPLRFWGISNAAAWPSSNHIGFCNAGDTCQIWDMRIQSSDTVIRNTSGDGDAQNAAFISGGDCPAELHGNDVVTNLESTSPDMFLRNAMEILFDDIGDEDGLCESNEACLYMPNFGAYQGHGDYSSQTCVFQDGAVSDVSIFAYPNNGY